MNKSQFIQSNLLNWFFNFVVHNWIMCLQGHFSCDQAALKNTSFHLSGRLSGRHTNVPVIVSAWNFLEILPLTGVTSMLKVKVRSQRSRSQRSWHHLAISRPWLQFEFTYGNEMIHKAWCCLEEEPYCFSRSSVKFQGHKGQKLPILTRIERFRTVTPVWIHPWLWNDAQSLI